MVCTLYSRRRGESLDVSERPRERSAPSWLSANFDRGLDRFGKKSIPAHSFLFCISAVVGLAIYVGLDSRQGMWGRKRAMGALSRGEMLTVGATDDVDPAPLPKIDTRFSNTGHQC